MKIINLKKRASILWILLFSTPFFVFGITHFRYSSTKTLLVLITAGFLYISLAILHHMKDKSLTLEVIIEYLLIAVLAMVILYSYLIY